MSNSASPSADSSTPGTRQPLKIVFAGTPDFAAHHLQALLASEHRVVAVYSQPDRPAGRGKKLQASPVKQLAVAHEIPVYQPLNFKQPEAREELAALQPDVMVVVAYGLILPQAVLDIPRLGCINVHASLLPRWRGAAPIQRAVEAGDAESGVTIMQMEKGLDTGPMFTKVHCPLATDETGGSLHDKLQAVGASALLQTLTALAAGKAVAEAQDDSLANYAHKIDKPDLNLDWQQPAEVLERRIRAFNPFPVCFTHLAGERIKIYRAQCLAESSAAAPGAIVRADKQGIVVACGSASLAITELQMPGKKPMAVTQVLNGYGDKFAPGTHLAAE
ncbi:methionyl-tRNA formyltransferase [Halioxenophilus sp. WMMB6]|uniref:methionyl-tRNA formyltransferase n=1 Tax=Halioxenophilus sp. WMMB6 TaxID=3073815 RepID=UPI00295EA62C|nr:methionyl-tRNA formyltransferase [Halioxenophilus sp. WMMB6]